MKVIRTPLAALLTWTRTPSIAVGQDSPAIVPLGTGAVAVAEAVAGAVAPIPMGGTSVPSAAEDRGKAAVAGGWAGAPSAPVTLTSVSPSVTRGSLCARLCSEPSPYVVSVYVDSSSTLAPQPTPIRVSANSVDSRILSILILL